MPRRKSNKGVCGTQRSSDTRLFPKDGIFFSVGKVCMVRAETIQAVYGLPVDIHYHKGIPVVLPSEGE